MTEALTRLLDGVFDYAGLFPPAKLSMEESVDSYLKYRSGSENLVLDRFVCSAARLKELREVLASRDPEEPIPVSVVGTTAPDWGDGLVDDAESMTRFIEQIGDKADIEAYEIRVPDHEALDEYLADLRSFNQVDVFCELPWGPGMVDSVGKIAEQEWIGAKARTGGLDAFAFPSTTDLAAFLQQCVQLEVAFKLTAGLHHPVRSHRQEVNAKMHGFLNVLAATAILSAHDLTVKEATVILDSEDPNAFIFHGQTLRFGEWAANLEDLDAARSLFVGIGSCSIEEPLADLQELNLI